MALIDDLTNDVDTILATKWSMRDGTVVPETADVALRGGGVRLEATMLYADLVDSTTLAMQADAYMVAEYVQAFLACACRIVRAHDGQIRSFDGDRVMAVFIGGYKNSSAMKSALKINWAFRNIIKPKFESAYEAIKAYKLAHCVGIDCSQVLAVRGGVRGNNDLTWIGRAPNLAAKLSALRGTGFASYITETVYSSSNEEVRLSNGRQMWESRKWIPFPDIGIYRSNWTWKP